MSQPADNRLMALGLIDRFIQSRRIKNCRPATIDAYRNSLLQLERWAYYIGTDPVTISQDEIEAWVLDCMERGLAAASIVHHLKHWRAFLRWLLSLDLRADDPCAAIRIRRDHTTPQTLNPADFEQLLNVWPRGFLGDRNRVICKLAYDAMLRRGEIVKLSIGDVDLDARTLIVRLAKGRWSRTVPYSPSTANTIQRYLIRHREKRPGTNLVCASNGRQLYDNYLGHIFYKASQRLGRRVTPHMLRHSGATQFVRNGGSLEILRRILGHRSIRTTEVYMHLSGADVISWADRCSPLA